MAALTGPTAFYTVASRLLVALRTALEPVDRACVVNGAIAWDECDCGLLAVGLGQQYLTEAFPAPIADTNAGCRGGLLAADLVVQIIRCAPNPPEGQLAPSCAALDASAREVLADAWQVLDTVPCTLEEMKDALEIVDYLPRAQPFRGSQGGCVGSELTVTVAVHRGRFA